MVGHLGVKKDDNYKYDILDVNMKAHDLQLIFGF